MKVPVGSDMSVGNHRVTVDRFLAEGGLAHVYLARLHPTGEVCVLKAVTTTTSEGMRSMQHEVQFMRLFTGHKNIVTFIDAEFRNGGGQHTFILMEYCPGGHCVDLMNQRLQNRLMEHEILKIFGDACEGVARMHYAQPAVIHRDIKVENLLVGANGDYKLCDFGSATPQILPPRSANFSVSKTDLDALHEDIQRHTTIQYRAPEMCDVYAGRGIDEKVDIWALGVMLYKLMYYTTPFERGGSTSVTAIMNARYDIPREPAFSPDIIALVRWCLLEDPRHRPTIYQLVADISRMRGLPVPIENIYHDRPACPGTVAMASITSALVASQQQQQQQQPGYGQQPIAMPAAPMIPQRFTGGMPPPLPQGTQSLGTTSPMRRGRPQSVGGMQQQMGQPGSLPPMPMMGSAGPPLGSGLDMSSAAAAATSAGGMPMPVTSMAMSAPMSGGAPQSSPYGAPPPMAAPPPQIMPWDAFGDGGGGQVSTTGGSTSRYSSMPMPSYEAYDPRMHFQAQQRTSSAIASAATSAATSATATGSGAPNLLLSSSGAAAPFMSLGSPEYQTGPNGATSGFSGGGGGDSAALSAQGRAQSLSTAGLLSAGGGGAGDTPASSPMYTSPPGSDPFRTAMYAVPPPSSAPPVMSMPVVTPPTAGMSASAQQQQQMQQQGYLGDGHTVGSRPKAQSVSGLIGRFDMMEMTQSPAQTAATPPPVPQKPPARGHRKSPSVGSTPVPQSAVPGQSSVPSMPGTSTAGWTPPSFASRVTAAEPQGPQPSWNPTRIIPPPPPNYSAPPVMPSGSGALSPSSADGGGAGYLAPMSPVPRVSSSPQPYLTAAEEAATTAATSPPSRSPVGSVVVRLYRGKELRMHYLDRLLNSGWEFKPKYFTRVVTESWRQRLVNRGGAPCMGFWLDRISQVRPVDGLHTHLRALLLVHYVLAHSDAVMACELANSRAREIVDRLARQWIASTAGVAQRPRDVFVEHYGKLLIKALEFHARMHSANPAHQATAGSVAAAAPDGSFHVARPELLTPDAMVELAEAAGGLIVDLQPLVVFFLDPETSNARCAMAYDPAVCVELHTAVLLLVESAYAAYTLHMYLLAGILRNPPPPTSAAAPRVGAMIDRLMNISNLIGHFAACASKVALASEIDAACYVIPRHRPSTDTSAAWSQPPSRVPKMLHRLRRFGLDTSALGNDVARLAEAGTITRRPEYGSVYSAADAEFDDSEQSS